MKKNNLQIARNLSKMIATISLGIGILYAIPPINTQASGQIWNYDYTGNVQTWTAPFSGTYQLEASGAQGAGNGGKGGTANATFHLDKNDKLYLHVGGMNGYNGGGTGQAKGGGASDIRLNTDTVSARLLAGAGGGGGSYGTNGGFGNGLGGASVGAGSGGNGSNGGGGGSSPSYTYEDGYWENTGYWQQYGHYERRSRTVSYQSYEAIWCYEDNTAIGGKVHSHAPPCSVGSNAIYGYVTRERVEYYDVWIVDGTYWVTTGSYWVSNGYVTKSGRSGNGGSNFMASNGTDENSVSGTQTGNGMVKITAIKADDLVSPDIFISYNSNPAQSIKVNVTATDNEEVKGIRLPNGTFVDGPRATFTVTTNGTYRFQAEDIAGNTFDKSITISTIDQEAPNSPTVNVMPMDNVWTNQNTKIEATANGDSGIAGIHHIEYRLSGAVSQDWTTYSNPILMTEKGITTIEVRVVDNAGNPSTTVTKTIKKDVTAPKLTVTSNIKGLTNTDILLTATAMDSESGVKRIKLPNGNYVLGNVARYLVSENGTYTFNTEDNLGNTTSVSFVVNNIKKKVLITNKREVDLELHAEDLYSGVTHMQFRNEEEPWTAWESYATSKEWVLSTVDGLKHVWVQYKDKVGNNAPPIEDIIILDMTKPTASLFQINEDAPYTKTKSVKLKLKGSDALTGVKDMYISNDNRTWTQIPYTEETSWVLSGGDGVKTVYLKISDVAGNVSNVITDTIFLDTTKPLANISINNDDSYSATRNVRLTLTYSDIGGSGVETVKVIEGDREYTLPAPTPNSPVTIPWTLDFGVVKTVSIVVVDKAGNVSNISSDSIIVDKLTIKDFTLEDVVNPLEFNEKNPFTPKVWAFSPQPMLSGGNITFSIDVKKAVDSELVQDKVDYKVEVVGDGGYHKAFVGTMRKAGDHYSQTLTIPKDAPNGAKVYVSATAQRKLLVSPYDIQTVYFPGGEDVSQKAQIGVVGGNIYDVIRFNEIQ